MRKAILVAFLLLAVPASASHAPTNLSIVRYASKNVTISWASVQGVTGYGLYVDGVRVSTAGPAAVQAKFGTPEYRRYVLGVLALKAGGALSTITVEPRWVAVSVDIPPEPEPEPPPPPVDGAHLWVDASGGSCTRSSVPVGYGDSAACSSFAAAYTAAASGDTVGVVGTVGVQKFAGGYQSVQGSGSKTLTFRGVAGNKVRQINFGSPNLTFDGINVDAGATKTSGAAFENGGNPFVFKNGSIGNVVDEKGVLVTEPGIVFDNVVFHDVVLRTAGVHNECIFAAVPDEMVIRNSEFVNCAVMDVFFVYPDWWSPLPPPYDNVTLEGNVFGQPVGTYSLYIGKIGTSIATSAPVTGWMIRNNQIDGPVHSDAPYGSGNTFCGNIGAGAPTTWKTVC